MAYCNNCGAVLPEKANFCHNCGAKVTGTAPIQSEQKYQQQDNETQYFNLPIESADKPKRVNILAVFCVVFIVLFIVGVRSLSKSVDNSSSDSEQSASSEEQLNEQDTVSEESGSKKIKTNVTQNKSMPEDVCSRIAETILYDENGISVTAKSIEYKSSWDTYAVNVEIVNDSENDISYNVNCLNINGFSIDAYAYSDIYSKCKDTAQIEFSRINVQLAAISKFKEIAFDIEICDTTDDSTIAIVPSLLRTVEYDENDTLFDFDGVEVFKKDGLAIYAKPNDKTNIDHPITFYFINDTDEEYTFDFRNIAYDGEMVMQSCGGGYLLQKSKKVFIMTAFFFEDIDVSEISKVDMVIRIFAKQRSGYSFDGLFETPRFTVDFD